MMATIIETKRGFIAGDPPERLPAGHHWCDWCTGDGLEYDFSEDDWTICGGCGGACSLECTDSQCFEHGGVLEGSNP